MKRFDFYLLVLVLVLLGIAELLPERVYANDGDQELSNLFNELPPASTTESPETADEQIESLELDPERLITSGKKKKFSGWGPYTREIKSMCAVLTQDGRALEFKALVDHQIGLHPNCSACDSLYKIIGKNCQPKLKKESPAEKKRKKLELKAQADLDVEEKPTPVVQKIILQREPSIALHIILQEFIERLEQDTKRAADGREALHRVAQLLRISTPETQSRGREDYFSLFSELIDRDASLPDSADKNLSHESPNSKLHVADSASDDVNQLFD